MFSIIKLITLLPGKGLMIKLFLILSFEVLVHLSAFSLSKCNDKCYIFKRQTCSRTHPFKVIFLEFTSKNLESSLKYICKDN